MAGDEVYVKKVNGIVMLIPKTPIRGNPLSTAG